ncbi:MAG TPA: hypothetical protein VGJ92_03215 [Methanocella sp.]|jgi:predicted regulator of Ras-like GTPase activity (Roadblock/LC7/MglB family)
MDLTGSLYNIFGVSEPLYLAIAGLVALLLAGSLSATVLEAARVYREYTAPVPRTKPKAVEMPVPAPGKVDITKLGDLAAQQPAKPTQPVPAVSPAVPPVDVVKDNLPDSMKAITAKYGLDWLTIASGDGLVIASTSNTPDEDAAVYSNLFHELYRARTELYYNVSHKDIHLLLVDSGSQKVIDVAKKAGPMLQDEAVDLRNDSRKIVERFVWSAKAQK